MIKLDKTKTYLNFEDHLSLGNILNNVLSHQHPESIQKPGIYINHPHDRKTKVKINSETGNASLTSSSLLYYPTLMRKLRQMKDYPTYTAKIIVDEIDGIKETGIESTIKSLRSLDKILNDHRKEKFVLDAKVNNLIMLYGQTKEKPIYNGSKPYYKGVRRSYKDGNRLVYISGIKYFTPRLPEGIYRNKYYTQAPLYRLSDYELLMKQQEENRIGYDKYTDASFAYVKGLVGGIINTPILIFRCAQSPEHRGKHYYLDLHTHKIINKLTEARALAKIYAGRNYKIDIWEKKQ
jgi:hypothetical protein